MNRDADLTVEQFEVVKAGHRAVFSPRQAIAGPKNLRKPVTARVLNVDDAGRATVVSGAGDQWVVPYKALRRTKGDVYHAFSRAKRKHEREQVYGGLKPGAKKALALCAKDARAASLSTCLGNYSGPMTKPVNTEMKRCRERFMRQHGIEDPSDRGQCQALPKLIERALSAGKVPKLAGVTYISADSGNVGIGDKLTLGGHKFKLVGYTPEGKVRLKDGVELEVPAEYVPRDKGTPVESVFEKLALSKSKPLVSKPKPIVPKTQRRRTCRSRRRIRRDSHCVTRGKLGRFKPPHARAHKPYGARLTGVKRTGSWHLLPLFIGGGVLFLVALSSRSKLLQAPQSLESASSAKKN